MIKDHEWCADLGESGASCVHTISTEVRDIEKTEWDQERFGQVCTTAESFANIKASILKLCNLSRKCRFDAKEKINDFFDRMDMAMEDSK